MSPKPILSRLRGRCRAKRGGGTPSRPRSTTACPDSALRTMDKVPEARLRGLMAAIVGFELEVLAWRPTLKLSQNMPAGERERVAEALDAQGSTAMARLMRTLAA